MYYVLIFCLHNTIYPLIPSRSFFLRLVGGGVLSLRKAYTASATRRARMIAMIIARGTTMQGIHRSLDLPPFIAEEDCTLAVYSCMHFTCACRTDSA